MKIICDCWLMCKMRNNCTNSRTQNEFWWLIEKRLVFFLFGNLNSQLMKIIEFKEYDFKIDQNSSRSITRVKRFYWTFFYRMCSMFNKIAQKFFEFQLKHFNHQVETIHDINVVKQISLKFLSMWIANKSDEKNEFIEFSNQSENVLLFDFHVSRKFNMIRRQYRHLLINIIEFIVLIQSIHQISIKFNSQKLLIKTNEIEIIEFHANKRIHQKMLK